MKILFTDLDGTLLNDKSVVSEGTKKTLKKFVEAGNKLVLSSGRPLLSVREVREVNDIAFGGMYIVANNGSAIYDCDNDSIVMEKTVPLEMVDEIWKLTLERGIHIQTYSDTHIISCADDDAIKRYTTRIHIPVKVADNPLSELTRAPYKMLAVDFDDHERLVRLQKEILEKYGDILDVVFSSEAYLEIFNRISGKGQAVSALCDYLGISIDDSYAAGDEMNDMSMVQAAGHGIAMCNGRDELKAAAEIITDRSNDEDGLADVIERLIM